MIERAETFEGGLGVAKKSWGKLIADGVRWPIRAAFTVSWIASIIVFFSIVGFFCWVFETDIPEENW
jgi:ABC-type dipeptide/oligopeptide/nickel transport system permease subunit